MIVPKDVVDNQSFSWHLHICSSALSENHSLVMVDMMVHLKHCFLIWRLNRIAVDCGGVLVERY